MQNFRFTLFFIFLFVISSAVTADITIERDDTFTLPESNVSITWGYEQRFNISQIKGFSSSLQIGDHNLSILPKSPQRHVNVTVYDYNLSRDLVSDQQFVKLQVKTGSVDRVEIKLNGLPLITNGQYEVRDETDIISQFSNGGELAWTEENNVIKNFTIIYSRDETNNEDKKNDNEDNEAEKRNSGSSIDINQFCREKAVERYEYSWINDVSSITLRVNDSFLGLQYLSAQLNQNVSSMRICIQRMNDIENEPPNGAVSSYYKIQSMEETAIDSAHVQIDVENDFVENHDKLYFSDYKNGWREQKAEYIEEKTYNITLEDFGLLAVWGENTTQVDQNQTKEINETRNPNATQNTYCGNNICNKNESWKSCLSDCKKPDIVNNSAFYINKSKKLVNPSEEEKQLIKDAQEAYNDGKYRKASSLAQEAIKKHSHKQKNQSIIFIIAITLSILFILFLNLKDV